MRQIISMLLMIILSGAATLQADRKQYLSSCRVAPILPASVENTVLKASTASVVYFDTITDASKTKKLLDYGYGLKKTVKNYRCTMLSSLLLSDKTFIKSDYSVAMPFRPQVGVIFEEGTSSVVFLFSFQSSTARIYENGIKVEELLIDDPNPLLFIFKHLLN